MLPTDKMKLYFAFFVVILSGCKEAAIHSNKTSKKNREINTLGGFRLSPEIDSLFNEYVKQEPNAKAYAIFTDKKEDGNYDFRITFAPFIKQITDYYKTGAISYFMYDDSTPVFIYTGLEDFVMSDSTSFSDAKKIPSNIKLSGEFKNLEAFNWKIDFSKGWSFVHLDTASYVIKGDAEYPFTKITILPPVAFFAPHEK